MHMKADELGWLLADAHGDCCWQVNLTEQAWHNPRQGNWLALTTTAVVLADGPNHDLFTVYPLAWVTSIDHRARLRR